MMRLRGAGWGKRFDGGDIERDVTANRGRGRRRGREDDDAAAEEGAARSEAATGELSSPSSGGVRFAAGFFLTWFLGAALDRFVAGLGHCGGHGRAAESGGLISGGVGFRLGHGAHRFGECIADFGGFLVAFGSDGFLELFL